MGNAMTNVNNPAYANTPRPEVFTPGGISAVLRGTEYRAMAIVGTNNVVVQVRPGQTPPESGFETDPSGWSKKLYRNKELDRVFRRNTDIVWRNCIWYVPKILPDQFSFVCRLSRGYTPIGELAEDPRTERGDEPSELWAHLTLDDIDALEISETEIPNNGHEDESTTRHIYAWKRPSF